MLHIIVFVSGNLSTELIDGVNINNLIFINDPIVTIKSDIHMQDLTMSSNSTAVNILDGCTLPKVIFFIY